MEILIAVALVRQQNLYGRVGLLSTWLNMEMGRNWQGSCKRYHLKCRGSR